MDLLELGDDELSPHVGALELQLLDLHVPQLHAVLHVPVVVLDVHPPAKGGRSKFKPLYGKAL